MAARGLLIGFRRVIRSATGIVLRREHSWVRRAAKIFQRQAAVSDSAGWGLRLAAHSGIAKWHGISHTCLRHGTTRKQMIGHGRTRWVINKQGPLLGLIALMFVIFLGQELAHRGWYNSWMAVPGEIVLSWRKVLHGTAGAADYRQLVTLLSCAFLHGSFEHVLYNMLYLWIFAALAADMLGQRWMVLIFVLSALSGSICHTLFNADKFIPMLGASGAVMGFEGAYLGLATRWHLPEPQVWPMSRPVPPGHLALLALVGVAMDYVSLMSHAGGSVAYGAHLGGFTAGLFLTSLVAPRPKAARSR